MMQTELSAGAKHRRAMTVTFALTFAYFIVEVAGGLLTNSLALLADAAQITASARNPFRDEQYADGRGQRPAVAGLSTD